MDVVISHKSALAYWRGFRGDPKANRLMRRPAAMERPVPMGAEILAELESLGFFATPERPLDLLFSSDGVRSRSKRVVAHSISRPLPPGSLIRLSEHVAITSPELTFALVGELYPFGQYLMAGCELCSTYRVLDESGKPLGRPDERVQVTSGRKLKEMVEKLELSKTAIAARGASYVIDGAASPMEAKVALLLCLPTRLGGFGLPRPTLNAPLDLSEEAYAVYPHSPCRMDLYWESAKLDVEYDGEEAHTGALHAKDVARAVALRIEGVDVLAVSKQQVYDRKAFAALAKEIASKLGKQMRIRVPDFEGKQLRLRRELAV